MIKTDTRTQAEAKSKTKAIDAAATRPLRILMIAPTSFFSDYGGHIRILEETQTLMKLGLRGTSWPSTLIWPGSRCGKVCGFGPTSFMATCTKAL